MSHRDASRKPAARRLRCLGVRSGYSIQADTREEFAGREDVEPGHGVSRLMRLIPELNGE